MPKYKYRGISEEGRPARGMILALNKTHAIESIKNEIPTLEKVFLNLTGKNLRD